MEIPIGFPNEQDKIAEEGQAFQRLPSEERFRIIFDRIDLDSFI